MLLSKNQAVYKLNHCYLFNSINFNDVMSKSREQRLITKEYSNANFGFILQYFSDKTFVLSKNSYCNTIGQSSFVSFTTRMAHPLSLCFVSNVQLIKRLLL